MTRFLRLTVQIWFLAFFLVSSLCFLLAYIPFTNENLFKGALFPQLIVFTHIQPWLFAATVVLTAVVFRADLRGDRRMTWLFGALAIGAAATLIRSPFRNLEDDPSAGLAWSLMALAPLIAWPVLASRPLFGPAGEDSTIEPHRAFDAAWQSAVFVVLLSGAIAWGKTGGGIPFKPVLEWSLPGHLAVSLGLFVMLVWIRAVARSFASAGRAEFVLIHIFVAVGAGLFSLAVLSSAATFSGTPARIYAACFGIAVSSFIRTMRDGTRKQRSWRGATVVLCLAGIGCGAVVLIKAITPVDWNFLFQKLIAAGAWLAAFLILYRKPMVFSGYRVPAFVALLVAVGVALVYRELQATPLVGGKDSALEHYAGYDASFRLMRDMIGVRASESDVDFYRFLSANTNIGRSVEVKPATMDLVDALAPTAGAKPHIFLFVIDSLRRDYLSAYNSAVHFTPQLNEFAHDSVVFENAFTRYGGTGLSEPSIWAGGLMLHKQYVLPFAPMNALAKLVKADGYQPLISRDAILNTILGPWPGMTELDQDKQNMNYTLCGTLNELQGRMSKAMPRDPMFVYSQSQDIHISVIQREGAKTVDSKSYEGFYAPYASRISRLDACFGEFVHELRARGVYDHSIIIVTADHGDSLGEDGRWGHAYTIYPEIVRVPLVIHLPKEMQGRFAYDQKAPAFLTDITPSLYYLLGHRPVRTSPMFGRPLFADSDRGAPPAPRDPYFVASSYGAVYGALSADGRSLYVADSTENRDHVFELSSPTVSRTPSSSERAAARESIRKTILEINRFYHFGATGIRHNP